MFVLHRCDICGKKILEEAEEIDGGQYIVGHACEKCDPIGHDFIIKKVKPDEDR